MKNMSVNRCKEKNSINEEYPCGDSNAGFCLRRAALYPLSYRGVAMILMEALRLGKRRSAFIETRNQGKRTHRNRLGVTLVEAIRP